MLQRSSSSSKNYQVLNFPGQQFSAEKFLKAEVDAYSRLSKYIPLFANSGLLFGKIKSLTLHYDGTTTPTTGNGGGGEDGEDNDDDESLTKVFDVKNMGDVSLTEALSSGYGWGSVMEITQRIIDNGGIDYTDTLDCVPKDPNMPIEPLFWTDLPFDLWERL